jgi:hypothetical protein
MSYEKYHRTTIDCSKIRPHLKELIDRCGSPAKASEYALIGQGTVYRIMHGVNCTVQQLTARKILMALEHRRREDRINKATHTRFLNIRKEQARREAEQERLVGY